MASKGNKSGHLANLSPKRLAGLVKFLRSIGIRKFILIGQRPKYTTHEDYGIETLTNS